MEEEMIRAVLAAALLAITVAACTSPAEEVLEVQFSCVNSDDVTVRFFPGRELAILLRNGEQIELPQQISGSGFIYSNGPTTIRGKGNDLTVEIGRMVPIQCRSA